MKNRAGHRRHQMDASQHKENRATIKGFLDFETARHLLHQIRAGGSEIDLSECEDMDSSGLGVLLIAQKEGVKLCGCQGKVLRIVSMVGMCKHCPPNSDCPRQEKPEHPCCRNAGVGSDANTGFKNPSLPV